MPTFDRMQADDLMAIVRQESQTLWLGVPGEVDQDSAEALADQPVAWTARRADGSILACFGIHEVFAGKHGVAWALLSTPLGADHLPLTRFIQQEIAWANLPRLELLAKASDIDGFTRFAHEHEFPIDGGTMVAACMAEPSPECRWACLLGFAPAHVLRNFGAASETYMLFERFARPAAKAEAA